MSVHYFPDLLRNRFELVPAIDDTKPAGLLCRQRKIGVPNFLVESGVLLLHPVGSIAAQIPGLRAREAGREVDIDEQRQVRLQAPSGASVECQVCLRSATTSATPANPRRIRKSLRKH